MAKIDYSKVYEQGHANLNQKQKERGVNYTITYKRQANRNYWTQIKITDIFDFEWEKNGYDQSIAVGFGNNYAYAMQELGVIKPFKIEIIREIARL